MKFAKIISLIAVICLAVSMAACGGNTNVDMDKSGDVKGNGGFVVETKDYVYFINGVETYSTEYKTGEVVKGALMRVKKSDFAKIGTADWASVNPETVVSKLIVSGDYTAGFYIFDDYVYYAVPSTEKDNTGTVKSSKLNFFRTKLDGSSTSSKIANKDFDNDASFRFTKNGDKVYLAVYSTSLFVYDAEKGKQIYSYEKTIDELIFDDDNAASVYFTVKPVNEYLYDADSDDAQQVKYQNICKYTFGEEKETEFFSGKGKYEVGENHDALKGDDGVSFTGATVDLIKSVGGYLYFSYTSLDSTAAYKRYVREKADKTVEVLNYNDKNAASVFADGSFYYGGDNLKIYYVSDTYGIMQYDYNNKDAGDLGAEVFYYSDTAKSASILGIYDGYMYLSSSGVYYRVNMETKEETRINRVAFGTSWYNPEVITVDGKAYIIGVYTDTAYGSYCYAVDIAAAEKAYKDYKAALSDDDDDAYYSDALKSGEVKAVVETTLLGKMTETDKKAYTDYYDQLVKDEK